MQTIPTRVLSCMNMKAHTVGLLVFLVLIQSFLCQHPNPFSINRNELEKTAKEGSCVEMRCKVTGYVDADEAFWYWIKNATWINAKKDFDGTVVHSNVPLNCSEDFKGRVENIPAPRSNGNCGRLRSCEELCSIRICDLNKNDTGKYMFRFVRDKTKLSTQHRISLTVVDNPCPITFEAPNTSQENQTIKLKCSTLTSCPSKLQINPSKQQSFEHVSHNTRSSRFKSIVSTYEVTWQDDGTEFSCQTEDNQDIYLIRKIKHTVEYGPRDVEAKVSSAQVKEGGSVTLACSGRGQPHPTFTWFKGNQEQFSEAKWRITSIKESQSGSYTCRAKNKYGEQWSTATFTVIYAPHVEVQISHGPHGSLEEVNEGATVTFECNVKKSSPSPNTFTWFKDSTYLTTAANNKWRQKSVVISAVQPEDSGVYKCKASNSAGIGESKQHRFQVKYKPRNTKIFSQNMKDNQVKVNDRLSMTCEMEANPSPWYSWYRYQQTDRSKLILMMSQDKRLTLERVQRADKACYTCNASNSIGSGDVSEPLCINVLFPPTSVELSFEAEVTEGQLVTLNCSAESFPPSHFTLTRSSKSALRGWPVFPPHYDQNSVRHTFTATSTNADDYTCIATNSEGRAESNPRKLVVKYAPKDVKIEARHNLVVKENMSLRLDCTARSHPPVTSMTWTKVTYGQSEPVHRTGSIFFVKSAGPSDSGFYSCGAKNEIGVGQSQQIEVKIHYGPKYTRISEGEKYELPDGTSSVPLSCFAHCYPPVRQYSWYKKADAESGDFKVSDDQNISVSSHEPGEYYCVAENDVGQRSSDSVPLFASRVKTILKFFTIFCVILFILCLVFFLYRHSRIKSTQQNPANKRPCCSFWAQWKGSRRSNLMNEAALTRPSRSRDDLLPQQSHSDSMLASNTTCVYSTVNLPKGKPAPSAQRPVWQNDALKEENSLNYASLQFEKHRKPEEEAVYAGVSKKQHEKVEDYENTTFTGKASHPYDYDTDTSEDENDVEVTYSKVTFKPKAGQRRPKRHSRTSEDNTQYSELKI